MPNRVPVNRVHRFEDQARLRRAFAAFRTPGGGEEPINGVLFGTCVSVNTSDYAITEPEQNIFVTTGSDVITLYLPRPSVYQNIPLRIKKVDTGTGSVIILPNGADTIDGLDTAWIAMYRGLYELISDGTNWNSFWFPCVDSDPDECFATVTNTNYTVAPPVQYVLVTTGASNRTITLPDAGLYNLMRVVVKKLDSGAGNVVISGTIDGAGSAALTSQYGVLEVLSTGADWTRIWHT